MMLQNKEWRVHTSMVNYWKAHKRVAMLLTQLFSVRTQQLHRTTQKAPLQSILSLRKIWKIFL